VTAEQLAERLAERFPDLVLARGEVTVVVERERLVETLTWLRDELGLGWLSDVSCTDWPGRERRIWMAYQLRSLDDGHALRVKVGLPSSDLRVPTVSGMHAAANWQEREVFDMFGVTFDGHPDLRRILMPEGWEGHPLRKDHPLGGVSTQYKGAFVPPPDERAL
jgi:NADH-quinone oxidoreductase subunit C